MATAFSTHYLSFTPQISASRKPSKTLQLNSQTLRTIHQNQFLHSKSNLGFRITRSSFKSSLRTEESQQQVSNNKFKGKADQKHFSSLKVLIDAYKEAFLNGDEKSVSEIEAMIYMMENEKNELVQRVAALSTDVASGKQKSIRLQADFENFRKRTEKDRLTLTSNAQGDVIGSLLPVVDNFERAKQQIRPETENEKKIDTSYQAIYKQFVETMRSLRVGVVETVGKPFDPSERQETTCKIVVLRTCKENKARVIVTHTTDLSSSSTVGKDVAEHPYKERRCCSQTRSTDVSNDDYDNMSSVYHNVMERSMGTPLKPGMLTYLAVKLHEAIAREESQEFKEGIIIQEVRRGFLLQGKLLRPAIVKVSAGPGQKKAPTITKESIGEPATVLD